MDTNGSVENDKAAEDYLDRMLALKPAESTKKWMLPQGNNEAKLVIVLGYPTVDMLMEGDLLSGPSGEELADALQAAGFEEKDYYLTTMVKYGIGSLPKPTNAHITECSAMLDFELEMIKPDLIIALGAEPFKRIRKENIKITDFLGNVVDSPYGKTLPNYSPGMVVVQDPTKRPRFREVFDLAKRYLSGTLNYQSFEHIVVDDPEVNKIIIQSYIDQGAFEVGYDAEWFGAKMTEDEVMYTFQYSCEPHKAVILNISKDGVTEDRVLLDTMKPLLEHPKAKRMGWNIRADDKRLILRGITPLEETLYFDGMKACGWLDSRWSKGLDTGIRYFSNYRPYYNDLYEALRTHKLKPEELAKVKLLDPNTFYEYCAGDAVAHRTVCLEMKKRIDALPAHQKDYWYNTYLPLTNYFIDLELNGVPMDLAVMEDITKKYVDKYTEISKILRAQTSEFMTEFNPRSTPDKKALLFDHLKLTPAYYTKSGKSAKPRSWYEKQKPATQKQYSPSTNGKSLSTFAFDLKSEVLKNPADAELKKKHDVVKTLLDLGRVGVFANRFLCKQGTDFITPEEDFDEEHEAVDEADLTIDPKGGPKKSSYWAALCSDGRLHPDFYECLNNFRSSSRPNVQNPASKVLSHIPGIFVPGFKEMPKDEQKNFAHLVPRNLRHIFYPGNPDMLWAEVDVAGADLMIAAYLSGDKRYIHDMLSGGFHLKKAREYFQNPEISKDDYSRYVSAKAITFRVAYTCELMSAALPIQAEIYAESGIYIDLKRVEFALKTWEKYIDYMAYRKRCIAEVEESQSITNARGMRFLFENSSDFKILSGWKNESLAYPIASELALFLWDVSISIKKQLQKDKVWMQYVFPVNSVHDASYWTVHKDLMKDNYFPEICKHYFTRQCKIATGDVLGMEMVVADRWKSEHPVFHAETKWDFDQKCWKWKK